MIVLVDPAWRIGVVQITVAYVIHAIVFEPFVHVQPAGADIVPTEIYCGNVSVTTTPVAAAVPVLVTTYV